MILKRYPPSTNRDSCLYFREIKVTSKYFFEAMARLEQIRRLMAEYHMKVGYIVHTLWSVWSGGVGFEQDMRIRCRSQARHRQLLLLEMKAERLG